MEVRRSSVSGPQGEKEEEEEEEEEHHFASTQPFLQVKGTPKVQIDISTQYLYPNNNTVQEIHFYAGCPNGFLFFLLKKGGFFSPNHSPH